jgi:hypothetical protein
MDRLARNLDDLRRIVLGLAGRGVHIVFVKEILSDTPRFPKSTSLTKAGDNLFTSAHARCDPAA